MTATPDRLLKELEALEPGVRADVLSRLAPEARATVLAAMQAPDERTALEKRLAVKSQAEEHRPPRAAAAVAYALGGLRAVIWLMTTRYNLGLYDSNEERDELLSLRTAAITQAQRDMGLRTAPDIEKAIYECPEKRGRAAHERLVERARQQREREHLERCARAPQQPEPPSTPLRRIDKSCRVIRPADAVANQLLTQAAPTPVEPIQMDESMDAALSELIDEIQAPETVAQPVAEQDTAKPKRKRAPRGSKCPRAIERDLDALVHEIVYFEDESTPEPIASEGPPADALTAIGGGVDGFTNQPLRSSSWDVIAGKGLAASDLQDFMLEIDQQPEFRAAATLQALSRVREALQQVDETADVETPVELVLQDVALLARQLLSRLR